MAFLRKGRMRASLAHCMQYLFSFKSSHMLKAPSRLTSSACAIDTVRSPQRNRSPNNSELRVSIGSKCLPTACPPLNEGVKRLSGGAIDILWQDKRPNAPSLVRLVTPIAICTELKERGVSRQYGALPPLCERSLVRAGAGPRLVLCIRWSKRPSRLGNIHCESAYQAHSWEEEAPRRIKTNASIGHPLAIK
mmetsp:Transcript_29/g.73  ORF Transcript_29/g.73 Transcript_29/m.73 type:complete len:192 (-) Transcript_29:1914-2489(-)